MTIKRKKTILLTTVFVCFALAIITWQFTKPTAAGPPRLERFLPAAALGFIQAYDLRSQTLHITESEAWRALLEENPTAGPLLLMSANHAGVLDASYAVALCGLEMQNEKPAPVGALLAHFNSRFSLGIFERRLLDKRRNSVKGEKVYQGVKISIWEEKDHPPLYYAEKDKLAVLANSFATITGILDVASDKAPSLAGNPRLLEARGRTANNDELFGFFDGSQLRQSLKGISDEQKQIMLKEFLRETGLDWVEYGAMTSSFVEGRVLESFELHIPQQGAGILREVLNTPPTSGDLLSLVPEGASQVLDASTANTSDALNQFLALIDRLHSSQNKPGAEDFLKHLTEKTGIDFQEDFLKSLGAEICLAQFSADHSEGLLLLNLLDENRMEQALEKVAEKIHQPITFSTYQDFPIRQITLRGEHRLSYTFINGNLVVSPSRESVERSVATHHDGKSLSMSPSYLEARQEMQHPASFIYYSSNKDYLKQLEVVFKDSDKDYKPGGKDSNLRPSLAFGYTQPNGYLIKSLSPLGIFPRTLMLVTSRISTEIEKDGPPHT